MWRRSPNHHCPLLTTGTLSLVLLSTLFLLVVGCIPWQSADGTRHTLVLGLGLVSTKSGPDQTASAYRCQTLGLAVQPGGLVLGYQSLQQTQISPEWQGVVQVSAQPGQPLIVEGHGPQPAEAATTSEAISSVTKEGTP